MINLDFKKAVDQAIAAHKDKQVLSFSYEGQDYFYQTKISNHRNAFAKQKCGRRLLVRSL